MLAQFVLQIVLATDEDDGRVIAFGEETQGGRDRHGRAVIATHAIDRKSDVLDHERSDARKLNARAALRGHAPPLLLPERYGISRSWS